LIVSAPDCGVRSQVRISPRTLELIATATAIYSHQNMATVDVDGSSLYRRTHSRSYIFAYRLSIGSHPALSLHSSNEPGELSQWLRAMMTAP